RLLRIFLWFFLFALVLALAFAGAFVVKTGQAVLPYGIVEVGFFLLLYLYRKLFKTSHRFLFGIGSNDLVGLIGGQRMPVAPVTFVGVPQQAFEDVYLLTNGSTLFGVKLHLILRKILQGIEIGIKLIVQAAFQFSALAGQFLGIEGKL